MRRQSGGRTIWNHWEVKGRIWAWFMQSLYDRDAMRWRDYHRLNGLSTTNDPDFDQLSLVRALHAGRAQGKPAFCSEEILWVVADYFCAQIIVFEPNTDGEADGGPQLPGAGPHREQSPTAARRQRLMDARAEDDPRFIPLDRYQDQVEYKYSVYGHIDTVDQDDWRGNQILLATRLEELRPRGLGPKPTPRRPGLHTAAGSRKGSVCVAVSRPGTRHAKSLVA